MATMELQYGVVFGKGDASDLITWEVELSPEEEAIYNHAVKMRIPLENVPELCALLDEAYKEIEANEIAAFCDCDDEYVKECQGYNEVDANEITRLVHNRDPHALAYFNLVKLSQEELDIWDAEQNLDELPLVCDFDDSFEPRSPFEGGYCLNVEICDPNKDECLEEEEAIQTLREFFVTKPGDYSLVEEYIECNAADYYDGDLEELAVGIAKELGFNDFLDTHGNEKKDY